MRILHRLQSLWADIVTPSFHIEFSMQHNVLCKIPYLMIYFSPWILNIIFYVGEVNVDTL